MTADEILNKIPNCKRIIKNANAEMRILQSDFNNAEDRLSSCIRQRDEAVIELGVIEEAVQKMPTSKYREMLKRYYIDGQTWESIAEAMYYSPTQVFKYRPLALKEFKETWEENQKTE